jgi:hypothetical protein
VRTIVATRAAISPTAMPAWSGWAAATAHEGVTPGSHDADVASASARAEPEHTKRGAKLRLWRQRRQAGRGMLLSARQTISKLWLSQLMRPTRARSRMSSISSAMVAMPAAG